MSDKREEADIMTIRVQFDENVRALAGGPSEIQVTGQTVLDALIQVARAYPSLHLFNCEGELRRIIRVQRNGQPTALTEVLQEDDTLRLYTG